MKTKKIISILAAVALAFQAGAAYAAQYPIFLSELSFGESVISEGRQSFDLGELYGWNGENGTIVSAVSEEDNYVLSAQNESGVAKLSTGFGRDLFLKAAPKGTMYWDFEDSVSFEEDKLGYKDVDASGNVIGENVIDKIAYGENVASPEDDITEAVGKWAAVNFYPDEDNVRINPAYMPMDNVKSYNSFLRASGTLTGSGAAYTAPESAKPAQGSNQVCVVRNGGDSTSALRPRLMGMRVKLSRDMIEPNREYKLSYHVMNNDSTGGATKHLMYAMFEPFDTDDNITLTDNNTNDVKWIDFRNYIKTTDGKLGAQRYWQKCETELALSEDDFNSEGYTTLWLLVSGYVNSTSTATPSQVNRPNQGVYMYFDDIALLPADDEVVENTFNFNCAVKGNAGESVDLKLVLDENRTLIEKKLTLLNDGWNDISGSFEMNSDDEYVLGTNHGDSKDSNNKRVKLTLSSTGNSISLDDVVFMREVKEDFNQYGGKKMLVSGKLYNSDEALENIRFKAWMNTEGIEDEAADKSIAVKEGVNKFFANVDIIDPEFLSDASYLEYKLTDDSGTVACENIGFDRFFANGVNILPENTAELGNVLKLSGTGAYLVEFSLSEAEQGEKVTVSCGGASAVITADGDGEYQAELDIKTASDTAALEISTTSAQVSNITMRKTADY